jgi:hypothetical protein
MRLPNISRQTKAIAFSVISRVVALGFSYFLVPDDLTIFHLFALLGALAGFAIGDLWVPTLSKTGFRTVAILLTLLVAISAGFTYMFLIQAGSANRLTIVFLGILITITFFAMAALFALTGVRPSYEAKS